MGITTGSIVAVDRGNFESAVIATSHERPVLIDFYAKWCGPCQMLGPLLEQLVQEYDFVLAKVDIDRAQDLANQYQVEGVPDVRLAVAGEVLPGFVGALPEPQLRELLETRLQLHSALATGLNEVRAAVAADDLACAKTHLDRLFERYPNHPALTLEAARFLVYGSRFEDAEKLLQAIDVRQIEHYSPAQALIELIHLQQAACSETGSDLDPPFAKAIHFALTEDYDRALPLLLEIVSASRKYRSDGARKAALAIFKLLGADRELTQRYQQELMLVLY
ncbi:thioredoxin domain protein-containing protein [Rubidibacter lacunae KORDI 51-2]|uniref:Thioredoxin domain protein-containing protein n=1 Tax=Rubidibacter lacunae KORDI 51-2 TaxID=582515 RepID=U5DLC1_9CHRO|nr:tetratricopeptide repeat protein [Rubidibacter lacunae]ERN40515.1 thioredoxin domain protein-containing protein [Rubidibacter lacunae KORDI 51-2]